MPKKGNVLDTLRWNAMADNGPMRWGQVDRISLIYWYDLAPKIDTKGLKLGEIDEKGLLWVTSREFNLQSAKYGELFHSLMGNQ